VSEGEGEGERGSRRPQDEMARRIEVLEAKLHRQEQQLTRRRAGHGSDATPAVRRRQRRQRRPERAAGTRRAGSAGREDCRAASAPRARSRRRASSSAAQRPASTVSVHPRPQ
jgi:hypothetical protein